MIMMKLKFIDSSRNKRERDENTVETTVTKMIIFEFKELLVNAKMLLTLMNETMMKIFFDFFSSLSACSLWLWHYLDAVCMLNYM